MRMGLSRGRVVGLVCVLAAVAVLGAALLARASAPEPQAPAELTEVTGYLGGEKISLFEDEEFKRLAADAGLEVGYRKAGSLAMMEADLTGMDYLFPSSQAAVEYGHELGVASTREQIVLNSPIVVYTYRDVDGSETVNYVE